jgi:RimJ/RimL family protein N-acetyltransferase
MKRVADSDADWVAGLPIGRRVIGAPTQRPVPTVLHGRYVSLVPLDPEAHSEALFLGTHGEGRERTWLYMPDGPFENRETLKRSLEVKAASTDGLFFSIIESGGTPRGYASYMRIKPEHGVMEVGNIVFAPEFQRTTGATEAMYLMARHAFDLGFRRYEWKCDALNEPSREAALRLGFQFEGVFRQHMIIKGRNRDTAWFSMLDSKWAAQRRALESWLDPANFDTAGQQKRRLSECRKGTPRSPLPHHA